MKVSKRVKFFYVSLQGIPLISRFVPKEPLGKKSWLDWRNMHGTVSDSQTELEEFLLKNGIDTGGK